MSGSASARISASGALLRLGLGPPLRRAVVGVDVVGVVLADGEHELDVGFGDPVHRVIPCARERSARAAQPASRSGIVSRRRRRIGKFSDRFFQKGVDDSYRSIEPVVLEVLAEKLGDAIHLCISPKMSIKPGELVSRRPAKSGPHDAVTRIEHGELGKQLFSFPIRLFCGQKWWAALDGAGNRREEFQYSLMR